MKSLRTLCIKKAIGKGCALFVGLLTCLVAAYGQTYEITPLVGATFGGTMHLEQTGTPNFYGHVADSFSFGVAGGYRFEGDEANDHDLLEFRYRRQNSHMYVKQDPLLVTPYGPAASFRPSIAVDDFMGDLTHEFTVQEARSLQPFVSASIGAAILSGPASSATRLAFGIGGGLKVFPSLHYGFRIKLEYLPTVMHTGLQNLVCAGGCVVILNGGVMNQFEVSLGPAFRF